jgi:hypothetical protein
MLTFGYSVLGSDYEQPSLVVMPTGLGIMWTIGMMEQD